MNYLYCIGGPKGRLLEEGEVDSRATASEALDEFVFFKNGNTRPIAKGMGRYVEDGKLLHLIKGKLSLTTMPKGYNGP